ncbi:MAG: glycosyltransferase, partial [Phycisphaerae bacterium]|nr:glycosyltransferase [Phycisphaerae bacterium]
NTMLLWDGRFDYEVRLHDVRAGVGRAELSASCATELPQRKEPHIKMELSVAPNPLEPDRIAPLERRSQGRRPRFSFVMIVLNGMPLIEYSLRSIYDFAHEIIVVEGAVKNCLDAANPDGSSRDGTVEFLRSFPDPQRKIRLVQGLWPEKCQMQNKALEYVTGDYVWLIDSDEVYKPQDLETLRDLFVKDPTITQVNFIPDNFWKGLDYIFVSPLFFQSDYHYRRLFKYVPGAVFTTHRPPTLMWPGSSQTTEQMHLFDGFQTRKMGILLYHYSYVFEHQVAQKNSYYARQWGDRVNGVDRQEWFDRCYRAWTPHNRQQIEAQYPVWINDRNSRTELFSGTHPPVMEEFRLRLRRATSSVSQDEISCPPVEASRESGLAGSASGRKVKVACDFERAGATVGTESQFAAEIRKLFARIRPRKIIETGTYLGRGTTTIIARALEEQGISDAVFCTIEVNPRHWSQAKEYFVAAGLKVHAVLGLSIPRSMLPSPDQIQKQTVSDLGGQDIFVDHRPGERVGAYYRETDFPDVPDNRLYECLKAFRFCPDFVLLDSAGHIGAIEFDYLLDHLQGPCHIALDDIDHIKHHRNFLRMQSDPRFEIVTASKEKFGFCIARFTPQPAGRSDPIRRILWLRTDSIGDALLSASMLPHIHRRFGDARITVVCQQHIAELYESCPHVEDILPVPIEHRWESDAQYQEFLGKVRACNPDLLLNSTWATHGLADLPGLEFIPRRIALRQVRNAAYTQIIRTDPVPMPELHRHRDFLRGLGIEVHSLLPTVWLTDQDTQFAEQLLKQHGLHPERTLALFAGTRTPHRQYEYYGQAIRSVCAENRLSLLALGGANDLGVNQRNMIASGAGGLNLSGRCTLRQTAALLRRCRLAIGAETGLAHLACAVGTPNVILLGGGHFGRFMPYSPLTTIAALPLDCYGCDWSCRYKRIHCVRDLNPGILENAVREALSCDSKEIRVCVQGPSLWAHHPGQPQWQGCQPWLKSQPARIITWNDAAPPEAQRRVASEVPADR